MVENGWYLLCPDCRELSDAGWFERYDATIYRYYGIDLDGSLWGEDEEAYTDDLIEIGHNCGFYTDGLYDISDFKVLIRNNRIEDWGDYWDRHKDELIEIAEELGLEIKLDKDDEDDEDEIWEVNDIWTEL